MPNPNRPSKYGNRDSEDSQAPSSNLWVGNLPNDVTDKDLMDLFADYGALDSLTSYSSRSYAFVLFKRVDDAKAAKETLQGTVLNGSSIKIEFAKPAKPCRQLWVGGISPSVTKDELEEEFLKFGKIEEFNFFRERNSACIEYAKLEEASQALKSMNGKRIGGDQIRVDFLRSLSSRRQDQWPENQDYGEGQFFFGGMGPSDTPWMPHDSFRKQHHSHSSTGRKGDGQPSKVLWIGYPPSLQIDEQMLHNAMILFGEIERIKSFPSRHYSFVEFRSIDEARRAKEGLQGRLFNDPRITIMYSSSSLAPAPGKDYSGYHPGSKGPGPDIFYNEHPFRPPQVDAFGHNRPGVPNNFPGPGILGPMRPFGPQASYEPHHAGPDFNDLGAFHMQDSSLNNGIGPNWNRPPPSGPGRLHSPATGARPPTTRPMSGGWDVFDGSHFQREPKRSRLDDALPFNDGSLPVNNGDDRSLGMGQLYGVGMDNDEGTPPLYGSLQGKKIVSPVGGRATSRGPSLGQNDNDFIWRGAIAKGGTPVCHARCVPIGNGIGSELPAIVNCSARTGLDMLTKHYAEAIGFEIVFFLPDSEHDFASYTEFLRYLGSKNRAGVAKLDDGTTLFLVPPSDFLTNILNVAGPERLYGVVLRLPQQSPGGASMQQLSHHPLPLSQDIDGRHVPSSQTEYGLVPWKEEGVTQMNYNRVLKDDSELPPKLRLPHTSESHKVQSAPLDYASVNSAVTSQAGVTLTPELIATLASFLPSKSSGLESSQPTSGSSSLRPSVSASGMPDTRPLSQGWKHENQSPEQAGLPQHLGIQYDPQAQHTPQFQSYQNVSNTPRHSADLAFGSSQIHDSTYNLPQQGTITSRPKSNFAISSQSGQSAVSQQGNQQYEVEVPHNAQKGYGMVPGMDAPGFYGSTDFQQYNDPVNMSHLGHGANFSQPQNVMPPVVEKANPEIPKQMQQLQSVLSGAGQGSSEGDVDKNQRYQSTLQFAASLLLQIQQQQQQQASNQAGQGSRHQQ